MHTLRSGIHWGAEETDRLLSSSCRPPGERACPHCTGGAPETVEHIIFDCTLYSWARDDHRDALVSPPRRPLSAFFDLPAQPLASFAAACRRIGLQAKGLQPLP